MAKSDWIFYAIGIGLFGYLGYVWLKETRMGQFILAENLRKDLEYNPQEIIDLKNNPNTPVDPDILRFLEP